MINELLISSFSMATAAGNPDMHIKELDRRQRLERAIDELPYSEKLVTWLRFGFAGPQFTLREIGGLLRLTPAQIRQVEARALRKLRLALQMCRRGRK